MTGNLVFCEECRDNVEYTIKEVPSTGTIKGSEYNYIAKEPRCIHCNTLIYVPEINDANLKALYDVYRRENGIISIDNIRAIPEKYNIGKRPLSLLLGWGELTFSRYYNGELPTKQYSHILTRIYQDPVFYREILEAHKENLKSGSSYIKSRKAVDALLSEDESDSTPIGVTIKYLLSRCGDITPLSLQKALYYIQGFYYAFYNKFLFTEDCEAWVHGPVYRDIYFRYCDYHYDIISKPSDYDYTILTDAQREIIDSVIENICCYSGKILEQFTHKETPWLEARGDLPISKPSEICISKESIGDYFTKVKSKYHMNNADDIRAYALDMFG